MTDLEDAIRETLRTRAEYADRPVAIADNVQRLIQLKQRRRTTVAAALSAAAIVIAGIVPLTVLGGTGGRGSAPGRGPAGPPSVIPPAGLPLVDTSATPAGWAPVAWADAQISVPSAWWLEGSSGFNACGGNPTGMVFAGQPILGPRRGCPVTRNAASIAPAPIGPAPSRARATTLVVNGLAVTALANRTGYAAYLVPELGVRVTARGRLAGRVLGTLTRSPLAVTLEAGPAFRVPAAWRWYTFGGIRFAAPTAWHSVHQSLWDAFCSLDALEHSVWQSNARGLTSMSCPSPSPAAGDERGVPWVQIGAGPAAASEVPQQGKLACQRQHGMRLCVAGYGGTVLTLAAYPPGAARPTVMQIGLAGSGVIPRTILGSIRPE